MALNLSNFDDVLKIDYMGPIREQLNQSSILLSRLEQREEDFVGKQAYLPLHTGRNFSIGSRADGGTLPGVTSQLQQSYDNATFNASYQYGRMKVTGPTIKASRSQRGAFVKAVDSEMKGLVKDLRQSINRQIFRDGSGTLTQAGATTPTSTSVTVSNTKYLKAGQIIDVIDESSTANTNIVNGDSNSVVSVTSSTVFVAGTTMSTTTDEAIVLEDTYNLDLWGLEAIVNTGNPEPGNFGGIDRTSNTFWQGNIVGPATVGALTLLLMQQAVDESDIQGEGDIGLIITDHPIKRTYGSLLVADKRYPPGGEITLDGGYKALEFNGTPVVADKDAGLTETPALLERMYFLDLTSLFFITMGDWDWMDRDGAVLTRVSNEDAYEAVLFRYFNFVSDRPDVNTALDNVQ